MVHKVIPEIDAGETIVSAKVSIEKTDTLETLEERIHQTEHKLIVEAVKKILLES